MRDRRVVHVLTLRRSNHAEVQRFLVGYQNSLKKSKQIESFQELINLVNDGKANELAVAPFARMLYGKIV